MENKLKDSLVFENLRLLFSSPKLFFTGLLFDILFIISILVIGKLSTIIAPGIRDLLISEFGLNPFTIIISIIGALLYLFLLVFFYSFFKYLILDILQSYTSKTEFTFKHLSNFYLLNVSILFPSLIIFLLIALVLGVAIKPEYSKTILLVIMVFFSFVVYLIVNSAHSYFIQFKGSKKALVAGLNFSFKHIRAYLPLVLVILISAILYATLYYFLLWSVKLMQNITFSVIISKGLMTITFIYLYVLMVYNRLYFYLSIKK